MAVSPIQDIGCIGFPIRFPSDSLMSVGVDSNWRFCAEKPDCVKRATTYDEVATGGRQVNMGKGLPATKQPTPTEGPDVFRYQRSLLHRPSPPIRCSNGRRLASQRQASSHSCLLLIGGGQGALCATSSSTPLPPAA